VSFFNTTAPLLPEILSLHGKWKASKKALIFEEETLTWQELDAATNQIANGLIANDIGEGDMVGIIMKNGRQMVEALLGVMKAGAVSVPINLSVSDTALFAMLTDAQISTLIATHDQIPRLQGYESQHFKMPPLFASSSPTDAFENFKYLNTKTKPVVNLSPESPFNVIYSSGTTGTPKGILHTHQGRLGWAYDLSIALRYDGSARTLFTIGLYSNISWVGFLCTLLVGGTLIIQSSFDTKHTLETIQTKRVTNMSMVPIQYQRLLEDPDHSKYDLSSLKAIMSCGSPLHADLRKQLFDRLGPVVIELFGLTEGVITTLEPDEAPGRLESAGKPLVGTDIKIIDDNNQEAETGISGEIVASGRIIMPGYLGKPEATRQAIWTDTLGKNWLRTGDIGKLDEEGYLYIVDRKKDMIISGGQNIYPQDIEVTLLSHPNISEAAVIGIQSTKWGETPLAVVVLKPNVVINAEDIKNWANKTLGKQQRIADVKLVKELPRNPNGKILKKDLRELYKDLKVA